MSDRLIPAEEIIGAVAADTIRQLAQERDQARALMVNLLGLVGDRGLCKGCKAEIYWVQHNNGRRAPYGPDGVNHFAVCSQADQFRKKKEKPVAGQPASS